MNETKLAPIRDRPWNNATAVPALHWKCGYCNRETGSSIGFTAVPVSGPYFYVRLCNYCNGPTFFAPDGDHYPGALPGSAVTNVPADLASLFGEARAATAAGAYTSPVVTCRKVLMHIAVAKGAKTNQSFFDYINYLGDKGYIPPDGRVWVDYIRQRSNEANHEIVLMPA